MKWTALPVALILAGCASAPPTADPRLAASTERLAASREWSDADIRQDVESSARERYGGAAFDRALAAEASVMGKLYHGLPYPPVQQPDGSWVERPKPVALLIREGGRWFKAGENGFAAMDPALERELAGLLASAALWQEPSRIPQGGCTDGGSTLLVVRMPRRAPQVRQGTCGGPPLHSRLISVAFR